MRVYKVYDPNNEEGQMVAIVADNAKEAKKLAYGDDCLAYCEYIDIRVEWLRGFNAKGLEKGEIEINEGLQLGVYSYATNYDCEECGQESTCTLVNGRILCSDCEALEENPDV